MAFTKIIVCLVAAAFISLTFLRSFTYSSLISMPFVFSRPSISVSSAANRTLGFEKIFALSRGTEWRLHGLNAAATLSGLDITVPKQPFVSPQYVNFFQEAGPPDIRKPSLGSAQAWLAHLNLLGLIVQAGYSTALIIEDDVDWAVEIKQQMTTLASKVREFTLAASSDDTTPYGDSWDVLWLGHCGEYYNVENPPQEMMSWNDETAGPRGDWRGVYDYVVLKDLPEGQRHMFWSVSPICTYAYAVTASSAQKILEWSSDGQDEAYDIHLATGCRSGILKCISVVDQLFHHYRPSVQFGPGSDIQNMDHHENEKSTAASEMEQMMGSTAVIVHSARCQALFGTTCKDISTFDDRPFK